MGAAKAVRRAAAVIAGRQTRKALEPSLPPRTALPVPPSELRAAISVIVARAHADSVKKDRAGIVKEVAALLQCDARCVDDVITKMASDMDPARNRPGAGRRFRIKPGTKAADALLGGLLAGFGTRHTTRLVNAADPADDDQRPICKSVVLRTAKGAFGLVVNRRKVRKTGSRDSDSQWAKSRLAICEQFEEDMAQRRFCVEGTLFIDEHSEFCVLGRKGHNGGADRWEWLAHRDEGTCLSPSTNICFLTTRHPLPFADGDICLPEDGGVLDQQVARPRAKHPQRADGLFGVCAPRPLGGRRQVGRQMVPLRYRGIVVGRKQYAVELEKEFDRVRRKGQKNRKDVADKKKKSRAGVWYDHCDDGVNPYEVSIVSLLCKMRAQNTNLSCRRRSPATAKIEKATSRSD